MFETYLLVLGVLSAYALPIAAVVLAAEKLVNKIFENKGE